MILQSITCFIYSGIQFGKGFEENVITVSKSDETEVINSFPIYCASTSNLFLQKNSSLTDWNLPFINFKFQSFLRFHFLHLLGFLSFIFVQYHFTHPDHFRRHFYTFILLDIFHTFFQTHLGFWSYA